MTIYAPTISTFHISSWPFDSLVVSLISGQGHFTCLTNIQDITYITEWEKKNKQHGFGLALSVKRENSFSLLWQSVAIESEYPMKVPHSYQERWLILSRWLIWLLSSQVPTPPSAAASLWPSLFLIIANSYLLTALWPCLFSSSSSLVGNLARKPFVWPSRQNKEILWLALTHIHKTNAHHGATNQIRTFFYAYLFDPYLQKWSLTFRLTLVSYLRIRPSYLCAGLILLVLWHIWVEKITK